MTSTIRLNAENPTPEQLIEFPNWENALDEEDVEGQDETTLRPSDDQSEIGEYVSFSAGTVWLNGGAECPALIEPTIGGVFAVQFLLRGHWYRINRKWVSFKKFEGWEAFLGEFELSDPEFAPLRFASHLPYYLTGEPFKLIIAPDGSEQPWK